MPNLLDFTDGLERDQDSRLAFETFNDDAYDAFRDEQILSDVRELTTGLPARPGTLR